MVYACERGNYGSMYILKVVECLKRGIAMNSRILEVQ